MKWSESRSVVSDSLWPQGLSRLWNSPGQNTGVGSLSLLQGIFPAQGLNPGLRTAGRFFTSWKGLLFIPHLRMYSAFYKSSDVSGSILRSETVSSVSLQPLNFLFLLLSPSFPPSLRFLTWVFPWPFCPKSILSIWSRASLWKVLRDEYREKIYNRQWTVSRWKVFLWAICCNTYILKQIYHILMESQIKLIIINKILILKVSLQIYII